ncbi:nucleoside phosphorylase domain-containing protein [Aspergillus crustosus]
METTRQHGQALSLTRWLPGDTNSYLLGTISGHNVVMVCLPAGGIGTNSNVQYGLMVGIGGGVPSSQSDIRLGDVVVSKPVDSHPGVVQYDFGKTMSGGRFVQTGTLNRPPDILLGSVSSLQAQYSTMASPLSGLPGWKRDQLFEASYVHLEFEDDCSDCDITRLVTTAPRPTEEPQVWYGLIASGNQVIKDGFTRDHVAKQSPVLCFEMEAAGIMNYLPCLVIRSICDYCDFHKKKKWQGYAAMTAAAYAKLLLSIVPKAPAPMQQPEGETGGRSSKTKLMLLPAGLTASPEEIECRQHLFITDPGKI